MSDGEADVRREFSPRSSLNLWVTDDGDLVSQSRIRRIRIAQDVVNSAEKAVYDTLWNTKFEEFQLFTAFSITGRSWHTISGRVVPTLQRLDQASRMLIQSTIRGGSLSIH